MLGTHYHLKACFLMKPDYNVWDVAEGYLLPTEVEA